MFKSVYPLLATASNGTILLDSTDGVATFKSVAIQNFYASKANVYINASGFDAVTSGLTISLYNSFDGKNYFLSTTLPSYDTATAVCLEWTNPGMYIAAKYSLGAVSIDNVRLMIELDEES